MSDLSCFQMTGHSNVPDPFPSWLSRRNALCEAPRSAVQRTEHLAPGAQAAEGSPARLPRCGGPADGNCWCCRCRMKRSLAVRFSSNFPRQIVHLPWPQEKTFFAIAINRSANGELFWFQNTIPPPKLHLVLS